MSRATVLAEAVKNKLNGDTFSQSFTAVRSYSALYSIKELKNLTVTVVAPSIDQRFISRSSNTDEIIIAVLVQQQCKPSDSDRADGLSNLLEEISERFFNIPHNNADWVGTHITVPYSPDDLTERQIFTGVIHLRYQVSWTKE